MPLILATAVPAPTTAEIISAITDVVYPALAPMLTAGATIGVLFGVAYFIMGSFRRR